MKKIVFLAVVFLTLTSGPITSNAITFERQISKQVDTPYIIRIEYVYIGEILYEIIYYSDETITMNAVATSGD